MPMYLMTITLISSFFIFVQLVGSAPVSQKKEIVFNYNERLKNLPPDKKDEALTLQVFKAPNDIGSPASSDMNQLTKWFCATSGEKTDDFFALDRLRKESCIDNKEDESKLEEWQMSMCRAFEDAVLMDDNFVDGLSRAHCVAVTMYTSNFYASYNEHVRNGDWKRYKVFTALLHNAIQILDQLYPLPPNTPLYRGMSKEFKAPDSKRIYFKHFVSTTLDKEVAEYFGNKTIIEFVQVTPILAARIMTLSVYPVEEEVLISPFEAFEFISKIGNVMKFKTAARQELISKEGLVSNDLTCIDDDLPPKLNTKAPVKIPTDKGFSGQGDDSGKKPPAKKDPNSFTIDINTIKKIFSHGVKSTYNLALIIALFALQIYF